MLLRWGISWRILRGWGGGSGSLVLMGRWVSEGGWAWGERGCLYIISWSEGEGSRQRRRASPGLGKRRRAFGFFFKNGNRYFEVYVIVNMARFDSYRPEDLFRRRESQNSNYSLTPIANILALLALIPSTRGPSKTSTSLYITTISTLSRSISLLSTDLSSSNKRPSQCNLAQST